MQVDENVQKSGFVQTAERPLVSASNVQMADSMSFSFSPWPPLASGERRWAGPCPLALYELRPGWGGLLAPAASFRREKKLLLITWLCNVVRKP